MSFSDLNVSTSTIMVYTNMEFNLPLIFDNIKIEEPVLKDVVVPVVTKTKKQKNINKKEISAPYGAIISIQTKNFIRGMNTRKSKKHWCTICRPTVETGGREKKIKSCIEVLYECTPPREGVKEIKYFCCKCNKTYKASELKKIGHFLNQNTLDFSIGPNSPLLNVMIFKENIKIAGCKNEQDAKNMIMYLWKEHLSKIEGVSKFKVKSKSAPCKELAPKFTFETVMKNYGFKLGFGILREPLNILMNKEEYSDKVYMSEYESTGHTNVNIKMYSVKPENFTYTCITLKDGDEGGTFAVEETKEIHGKKVKAHKDEYVTFIVFSSSEVILSGKYTENMRDLYNFFREIITQNKNYLEEKLLD
jgi:hypothetical protein